MPRVDPANIKAAGYYIGFAVGAVFMPDHGDANRVEKPGEVVTNVCRACGQAVEAAIDINGRFTHEKLVALVTHVIEHLGLTREA